MKAAINSGKVSSKNFTQEQLDAIQKEKIRIPDLTWHHHQDRGRMQLIPRELHAKTGHVGGMYLWFFEKK